MIAIVGAGLPGLAAAARLARAGDRVVVFERTAEPGAGLTAATEPGGSVLTLPSAWRDLFRKSGRTLEAELARLGLALVPAPPRRHLLADGTDLLLPTDRGEQWAVLSECYGAGTAARWRDLLDRLDDTWQVLRRLGLEVEFGGRLSAADRTALHPRESLTRLAGQVPELAEVVLDVAARLGQDPRRLPGWHAARLAVERSFGRWQVTDAGGGVQPASVLVRLLVDRLSTLGVEVLPGTTVTSIRSGDGGQRLQTTTGPFLADLVVSTLSPGNHADLTSERVDIRTAQRLQEAPGGGPRWSSWRTLLDLPGLEPARPGVLVASAWSPGGPDSWAQLLTGALAAYRAHAALTGQDLRPTNKTYRPPRLIRGRVDPAIPGRGPAAADPE